MKLVASYLHLCCRSFVVGHKEVFEGHRSAPRDSRVSHGSARTKRSGDLDPVVPRRCLYGMWLVEGKYRAILISRTGIMSADNPGGHCNGGGLAKHATCLPFVHLSLCIYT